MAITRLPTKSGQGYVVLCLSSDTKPASTAPGVLIETDTGVPWYPDGGGGWTALSTGSGTVTTTGSPASGNLTKFSGAASITNGDLSGDVTTSGTLTATIANDAVTYAKIQNVGANEFLGRAANSSGDVSGIALSASQIAGRGSTGDLAALSLGAGLSMSGTTISSTNSGGTWVQLARQVLGSDVATVTFSSISGSYNHLKVIMTGRDTNAAAATNTYVQFNGDTGANYDYQYHGGFSTTSGQDDLFAQTSGLIGFIPGAGASRAAARGQFDMLVPDYTDTTFEKTACSLGGAPAGSGTSLVSANFLVGWRNTAAITQIVFLATTNFKTGSIFTLYGIS